jgi:CheY-like chemotaxis protein
MLREEVSILVVDDVAAMRTQIRDLLKSFGFEKIRLACSGEDGKTQLEESPTHLVLCDWQMQPTDGL